LLEATRKVYEFPPGYWVDSENIPHLFYSLNIIPPDDQPVESLASHLHLLLEQAVLRRIDGPVMGCWLSGGLDSSAMAALWPVRISTPCTPSPAVWTGLRTWSMPLKWPNFYIPIIMR
jgi:asparagine synthetase B (glutamine-hydrolysing)